MSMMKFCGHIARVLMIISFCGCQLRPVTESDTISLVGEDIVVPEDFTGGLSAVLANDTIYFNSFDPEYKFVVGSIENDTVVPYDSVLKVGQGPGEVLDAALFKENGGEVYAIVRTSNRAISMMKKIELNHRVIEHEVSNFDSIKGYVTFGGNNSAVFTSDSTILFLGGRLSELTGMFSIIDLKKGTIESVNFFPEDGVNCLPRTKFLIYSTNGYLASNNHGQYLYEMGFNKFAFIFHLNNGEIEIEKWLFDEYPKYSQSDEIGNFKYEPEVEKIDVYVTDSHIYVLQKDLDQTGRKSNDFADSFNGNKVAVFDWEGNKVAAYDLDAFGYKIFVDKDETMLYLEQIGNASSDYGIRKYKLPKQ